MSKSKFHRSAISRVRFKELLLEPLLQFESCFQRRASTSLAVQGVVWLQLVLRETGLGDSLLHQPPQSLRTQYRSNLPDRKPRYPSSSEHIDVKYHHIRDQVARGLYRSVKIPTTKQVADGLTKPLDPIKFERFVKVLGLPQLPGLGTGAVERPRQFQRFFCVFDTGR